MENSFTIKNFRVFDEKGTTFNFKPITLLTGTNSSGKSSLTKAVVLMHDFLSSCSDSKFELLSCPLDFAQSNLKLGGFKTEKNRLSRNKEIVFSYSVTPICAANLVFNVEYSFVRARNDSSFSLYDNGALSRIVVRIDNKTLLKAHVYWGAGEPYYVIDTINVSHPDIFKSFEGFYILLKIVEYRERIMEVTDLYGIPVDEDKKREYERRISELLRYGYSRGVMFRGCEHIEENAEIQKVWDSLRQSNSSLVIGDLSEAFNNKHETNSFFHFSVFDESDDTIESYIKEMMSDEFQLSGNVPLGVKEARDLYSEFCSIENKCFRNLAISGSLFGRYSRDNFIEDFHDRISIQSSVHEVFVAKLRELAQQLQQHYDSPQSFKDMVLDGEGRLDYSKKTTSHYLFRIAYDFFSGLQFLHLKNQGKQEDEYVQVTEEICNDSPFVSKSSILRHKLYLAFCDYLCILIQHVLSPYSFRNVVYYGDSHENIKRVYSLSDKSDLIVSRLVDHIRAKSTFDREIGSLNSSSFVNAWLQKLGLGKALDIHIDNENKSATIMIQKNDDKHSRVNLADEGYGVFQLVVLLLSIETEVYKTLLHMRNVRGLLCNPEFNGLFITPTTMVLEEPEANLHPALQSKLAEILNSAYEETKGALHFIVETHSEYLIRATQAIVAKTVLDESFLKTVPFVVYYMEKGGKTYDMEYQVSGRFKRPFGTGFFDEAGKSAIEILKKERRMNDGANA